MVGSPPPSARPGLDELADSFAASFNVTNNPDDTNRPHPRFAQYKMKTSSISQEVRLGSFLESHDSARLKPQVGLEILSNFTNKSLE